MLISNPDLINSCRVCRSPNQDGDYECLYENTNKHEEDNDGSPVLSEAGILYENLLNLSLSNWYNYPQFLCNSCDLQMKLFKKLKNKAHKTWEYLQNLYEQQLAKQEVVEDNVEMLEDYEEIKEAYDGNENEGGKEKELNAYEQSEMEQCIEEADKQCQGQLTEEYYNQMPYANNQEQSGEYQQQTTEDYQGQNVEEYQEHNAEEYQEQIGENLQQQTEVQYQHHKTDEYTTNSINEFSLNSPEDYADNTPNDYRESNKLPQNSYKNEDQTEQESSYINTNTNHQSQTSSLNIPLNLNNETKITDLKFYYSTVEIQQNGDNSQETIPQIRLELEPVIDKSDYVTEIYELLEDEDKTENGPENNENIIEYDVYAEDKTETNSVISSNLEYIIEEQMFDEEEEEGDLNNKEIENKLVIEISNATKSRKLNACKRKCTEGIAVTTKKREYKCEVCQLEFQNAQEHKQHRNEVHNKMFPCSVCGKELKSLPSLHLHMKIHAAKPAHQCEICQKTFNQKAHYQYHMKRHNNERNFKCDVCEKAFITKTDLKVHQRLHTGIRPYVCNICNKDYMMMEHLKAHLLTHTDEYFQCDICKHKFATHKTLRQHVKTIHEDGAKFKCSFCGKAFRRKHHLEYHLRLHQKNVKFLDSHYELVDETAAVSAQDLEEDFNIDADDPDELTDADLIVDTGFIALNDDLL